MGGPATTPGYASTVTSTGNKSAEAEARQKRVESLLQSRGVPLVGPVRYNALK